MVAEPRTSAYRNDGRPGFRFAMHPLKLMTPSEAVSGLNIALAEKHLQIWSERDPSDRLAMIREVYADALRLVSPSEVIIGSEAVNDYITQQQATYTGYHFKATKPVAAHHDFALVTWQCGPESAPDAVTGIDVLQISGQKIQGITIFIND